MNLGSLKARVSDYFCKISFNHGIFRFSPNKWLITVVAIQMYWLDLCLAVRVSWLEMGRALFPPIIKIDITPPTPFSLFLHRLARRPISLRVLHLEKAEFKEARSGYSQCYIGRRINNNRHLQHT